MRLIACLFFIIAIYSCSKEDAPSPNNVKFSINDSAVATCTGEVRPDYDFIGGPNCEFQFDRTGLFKTGETAEIAVFAGYHCEIMSSPLPFQTRQFTLVANLNPHAWETISYDYRYDSTTNTSLNTPGNLILTILQRENNQVRGTIKGTIYRADVGQNLIPASLDCSFDLAIPLIK